MSHAGRTGFGAMVIACVATSSWAESTGDPTKGRMYAERICAGCHSLDPAVRRVPEGRPASFRMIANTPGMTALALSVWFRTPHTTMPNLVIPEQDRDDLSAYILTFKDR